MQFNSTTQESTVNGQPEEAKKENFFAETKKLLEQYIQDRILLFKLEMSKKAALTTAGIVNGVTLALLAFFALTFVSVTLGFVFSAVTNSFIWGFGIVALLYIALIVIVVVSRKWITRKVANAVISSIYQKKKSEKVKEDDSHLSKN